MRSIRTASLAALATVATTGFSTAALAHPGLPGHSHEGLAEGFAYSLGNLDYLLAIIAGAVAASLTVWALSRRRSSAI